MGSPVCRAPREELGEDSDNDGTESDEEGSKSERPMPMAKAAPKPKAAPKAKAKAKAAPRPLSLQAAIKQGDYSHLSLRVLCKSGVRQGQDVGVEVARKVSHPMRLAVLTVSLWSSALTAFPASAVVAVLLPHRRHLPRLGAAEVLEGHGQLAQDAVPRLLQVAVRPPLFSRPSLRRRVGRRSSG